MVNQLRNRVNVVSHRPRTTIRVVRLTRWKPFLRGGDRGRFYRRRQLARRARVKANVRAGKFSTGLTLVGSRNNFWALLTVNSSLVWTLSAGGLPGFSGSKRGRLAAAGKVASLAAEQLRRRQSPLRVANRGVPQSRRYPGIWLRRPRRWTRRGRLSRRGTIRSPLGLTLVGWTRDKRWRYAWGELGLKGRTKLQIKPRRGHNGLRGKKVRRT